MSDKRISFIVDSVHSLCQLNEDEKQNVSSSATKSKEVQNFLDDPRLMTLRATVYSNGESDFTCQLNTSTKSDDNKIDVLFVKRTKEPLSPDNIGRGLDVHTIHGSPVLSLLSSLKDVWCPTLLDNTAITDKLPSRVKQLLAELESTLSNSITGPSSSSTGSGVDSNLSDIIDPIDEINHWSRVKDDRRSTYRHIAKPICDAMNNLTAFADLSTLEPAAVSELVELSFDVLNNIWNATGGSSSDGSLYPQARMKHFIDCIGSTIVRYVQHQLASLDIWSNLTSSVRMKLQASIRICEQWCNVTRRLTSTFWPGNQTHPWQGPVHEDSFTQAFLQRLEKVLEILSLSEELFQILSPEERASYQLHKLFDPLKETRPVLYNPYTEPRWARAVREYEKLIDPVENTVAVRFKRTIGPFLDRPQLLLTEFQKYKSLMKRPTIRRALVSERETLLSLLNDSLKTMEGMVERGDDVQQQQQQYDNNSAMSDSSSGHGGGYLPYATKLTSPHVTGILILRQIGAKVSTMYSGTKELLSDLDGYKKYASQCKSLISRVKAEENSKFESWMNDVKQKVEDGDDSSLKLNGSLVGWKDGVLVVNFSDELVKFLREYRQLDELGFEFPKASSSSSSSSSRVMKNITDRAIEADKFYRCGILLKKTANFYNSISEQMIDVQEQLLLGSLSSFASLVSKPASSRGGSKGELTWSTPSECESYIKVLQEAAEKLSSENRSLRKAHESLCAQTLALMSVDLHRQGDLWKSKWRAIKEKMNSIRSRYNEKDCRLWVLHWDHQVYKALEASYQMGLQCINESLTEIKAELIFANKSLDFKPPLENIRQTYYKELKRFVSIPYSFDGLGGNASIYKKMGPRNTQRLVQVYLKAESLFDRLNEVKARYLPWVALGKIDLDAFLETHVRTSDEYVVNFKALRAKSKEIDKLPDVERVDCCLISLTPLKSYLDDLLLRIGETLLVNLRRSLIEEFKEVDSYLEASGERLHSKPQTVDEISDAKKQWKEIEASKSSVMITSKNCVEKKKLLLQYAPGTAVDITDITAKMANLDGEGGRWDTFEVSLGSYNEVIEGQKEVLKGFLEEEEVNINVDIERFGNKWRQLKPTDSKSWDPKDLQVVFDALDDWKAQFASISVRTSKHTEARSAFGMKNARFDGVDALTADIAATSKSWDILKEYLAEEKLMSDEDWINFTNVYVLQDFAVKWADTMKQTFSRGAYDSVAEYIVTKVERIKKSIAALKYCKSEAFKEDHWTELLQGKLQLPRDLRADKLKVEHFLSKLDILMEPATLSFVKNLQARALGEVQIREAMQELRGWELSAEVRFLTQEESGRVVPLIKEWKDLFLEIGDKQSLLGSLKESPFFKAFSDVGLALEAKISTLDFVLHTLNAIQRKWVYLEPIFARGALPAEESRFKRIDEGFKDIMNTIVRDPKLFYLADEQLFPRLSDSLRTMLDQLERCQKALTEFLEAKRSAMPRFYFIGDDDLLEILGQAKNPNVIQSHLKKLFQGIHKVRFGKDSKSIDAMISSANEVVELQTPVPVSERVEDWLHQLAEEMRATLSSQLDKCLNSKTFDWNYPSQILCLAHNIRFTEDAEAAIEEGRKGLDALLDELRHTLSGFTSNDLSSEPLLQLKMKSLVFDIVHNIDIVCQLQKKHTSRLTDWQWSKQLRYYFEGKKAIVRMHDAEFQYTFEYQGNAPKLVYTPLTDRCYLTLTQGMHMGFGGNPYGPAGTGKTESVKALASCMGRQVLVFNCDEALESTSMVRIFIGIVKCGAWGCFDEFNRLKEDQLSAISQQIQTIQDAIKTRTSPIHLLNRNIDVDFNSGIFVTLNPPTKQYGGRSRLPDNLKALFRPVAMGAPDNELIAEVSLVTEGFTESKDLASKIVSLFRLSKQLLSPQRHYDWGLRALKAVLNSGGRLIQSYKVNGTPVTTELEFEILIKAVRVNTLSKLTFSDTIKFLALIGDVFPGVKSADIAGGELEAAIKEVMRDKPFHLVEDPGQVKKMIQLKESLDQRMGCVVVGPSGCGKSTLWRVLKAAMIKCGAAVVTYVMNPKSMPRERLLGHMDLDTREWADGVLTDAARKVVKESSEVHCWIICDGDVDPEWIESLNSVLDDNHLLTLPNGERISFGSNVNFLFETHDLKFASPATVSRMGMIFLSDEDLDVARLVQKWLTSFPQDTIRMSISSWLDELFYQALEFVLRTDQLMVETTLVGTVNNGLSQLRDVTTRHEFICALIRGIGGNLNPSNRVALAKEVFQWANERPPDFGSPLDCCGEGSRFEAFTGSALTDKVDLQDIGERAVVPTIAVQRTLAVIEPWIKHMDPFILVGPEGCGKSMIINYAFRRKKNVGIATLHCNAQTASDDVIKKISQICSLYSSPEGRVYRPRDCDRLVLYLKDINLPRPDMYDTCQLIAFLQQIITFGGFYDEALEFLKLERIQIVASINAATTVGRHPLSTRFTAAVRIYVVDYPETAELVSVYNTFLSSVLSSVKVGDARWNQALEHERLANAIVEIYLKTREKFTVDDCRHYLFTPRDMTLLVKNICRYNLEIENLLEVIAYESCRVFRDRLVNSDACNRFDQQLSGIMRTQFRHTVATQDFFFTSLSNSKGGNSGSGSGGTTRKGEGKESDSTGSGLTGVKDIMGGSLTRMSQEEFQKLVAQGIVYYEREERDLNMLLFSEVLEHIAHIDRTISSNCGHLLLVGKSGVGRRNAVTIATYMLGHHFYTPAITRDYGPKQFSADVKGALETAGIKGEHVVLFIEDYQITKESILEMVNSLLSSGEVPGMYTHEELEPLMSSLRKMMQEEGIAAQTPYECFVSRIKKYLHVVLSMDPGHPSFLFRCESNPALYAQCTVIWIGEWRNSSLKEIPLLMDGISDIITGKIGAVSDDDAKTSSHSRSKRSSDDLSKADSKGGSGSRAEQSKSESKQHRDRAEAKKRRGSRDHHLDDDDEEEVRREEIEARRRSEELVEMVIAIHTSSCGAPLGATPKDYITFLQTWYRLYTSKKEELVLDLKHLEAGLFKLDSATDIVNDLRTNAKQQAKDLAIAQTAADRAMEEISKAISSSTDRRNEVSEVRRIVGENEVATQARKQDIERELAEIQPILDSAKVAVGSIKNEHLTEIRSLSAPPEAIADVLAAVLMLLGVQDLSWLSMKKFLSNRGVKDDILNYDARRISEDLRKNVAKLLKKKPASFDDANIQRVSIAAAPMAAWVKANIRYSLVIEKIEPLQVELEEEVRKLEQSQKRLSRCEEELREIDDKISTMKKEFASRTSEAERLKSKLSIAGSTLDKAERLIGQLSGEQSRWKTQTAQLRTDLSKLPMKMLLAAGFTTYLAKTPEDVRTKMIDLWQDITHLPQGFVFKRAMSTESELLQWKMMGLPSDDLSQENSLVISNASDRVPFIIDPASAATEWLRGILSKDRNRPLEVVTPFDARFMNQVELAVRFGKTLLVLEVDGLEAALYPLCRRDLCHQGPRWVVNIGDKTIDYNEGFRLYLVTRHPAPDIPPDAAALLTVVNFTVTRSGLEGQLLGLAIQHEQPELEKAKGEMLRKEEDFKVQLAQLEKNLLQELATAEGNLLENTSLIESLTRTKEKSAEIEDALVKSADASIKLDEQREVYRPFALSGAKLFFLVKALQNINHMYQFSLSSFLILFKQALSTAAAETSSSSSSMSTSTSKRPVEKEDRLLTLAADLEVRTLYFVGRALFKADRPMFALHLVKGMHADHFQSKEWDIFTGGLVASVTEAIPRGYPSWAPSERKDAFRLLTEQLPHLINSLEIENSSKWQRFSTSLEAERDLPVLKGVSPFQRVLIVQAFRPDRLQSAILQFCTDMLRIESVSPPPLSLQVLYEETAPAVPLLLISSPGADASKELQEYATKTVGAANYEELAMGGGQQEIAQHLLRTAAQNGSWLCLKNLHLVVTWLPTLEKELSAMQPHENFRLFLTSESHSSFASILLQQSLKATFESPPGIKKNLQRTFDAWDADAFDPTNPVRSRLLFLLACFHSVMQERRTYIPQGWTKFYEFSYGDLKAGTYLMEAVSEGKGKDAKMDWQAIHGLMEDAIYGGRIDNYYDLRVLRAYLSVFFCDRLAADGSSGQEVLTGTPLRMPANPEFKSFGKLIQQLPDTDAPYVFSLPDNIERSLQRTNSTAVIKQLRVLSSHDAQAAKYDRDKWRAQLGPILDLWQQLTSSTPGVVTRRTAPAVVGNSSSSTASKKAQDDHPVDDFVLMEFDLAGDICVQVDSALASLKKVLFGSGLLTPSIQHAATALLSGSVPADWRRSWDVGPEKPQSWLRDLVSKRISLAKWKAALAKGGSSNLLSSPLVLGDLFNPATFINALRQQTARQLGTAIDLVKMICSWDKDGARRIGGAGGCPLPCTLSNLYLQGATFQSSALHESAPEAAEIGLTPPVCIGFVPITKDDTYRADEAVSVPIYLSPTREDFLMELQMPIKGNDQQNHWILTGIALFLSGDDA